MMPYCNSRRSQNRSILFLFAIAVFVTIPVVATGQSDQRPNILFVMSDDHATSTVGAYEGRYADLNPTPNIDRIAEQGMLLENALVTNSICVPSRATILSGQYSHVDGIPKFFGKFKPRNRTVAELFKEAGYQTAIIGKWHLSRDPSTVGFQDYIVLPGQGEYNNPVFRVSDEGEWPKNKKRYDGHSADVIGRLALDWLKNRDPDKPFLLMVHFKSTHADWEPPDRYDDLFADQTIPEPKTMLYTDRNPTSIQSASGNLERMLGRGHLHGHGADELNGMNRSEKRRYTYQHYMKQYLGCVRAIDDNVGRLQTYLDDRGITDRTVLMYTSDQGHFQGEYGLYDKRFMYEPTLRMPFLVQYPPEISSGVRAEDLVVNADFAPTMLDYAGLKTPDYMQGRSFRPILKGNPPGDWRRAAYYRYWGHRGHHHHVPAHYGIRTQRYKLIFFYGLPLDTPGASSHKTDPHWALYDLKKDPRELNNVYRDNAYRDVVKRLTKKLVEKKQKLGDTDESYPKLQKRFRETTVVEEMK